MAKFQIRMDGVAYAVENINLTSSQMAKKIDFEIQRAGKNCQKEAKANCPVLTGALQKSITYTNTSDKSTGNCSCTVSTDLNYAVFVEFGTRFQTAQPYLYPAYALGRIDLQSRLKDKAFMTGGWTV